MQYSAKYKDLKQYIPQEKRKEINEKILYLIDNDMVEKSGFTKEIISNMYTGDGGLHGLNYNDFNSFHAYTEAKKEIECGQFMTGFKESKKLIESLGIVENETVLELTAGKGDLLNYLPSEKNTYCNEIDMKSYKVLKYLYPNVTATKGDMRSYKPNMTFDICIGNPPFNLSMEYKGEKLQSQMVYIRKANELLKTGSLLGLIVPYSFLGDEFANKSDIEYMNENFNFICQVELNKDAFSHVGVDNFKTKMMFFMKKSESIPEKNYSVEFVEGSGIEIFNNYIKPIRDLKEKFRSNIRLENMKNYSNEDEEFNFICTKLLLDIRRTKATNKHYNNCFNYYNSYFNQEQPASITNEEWQKIKVTKDKVINRLKSILSKQHNRKKIKSENLEKVMRRKIRESEKQSVPFDSMKLDKSIEKWLGKSRVFNYDTNEPILLNQEQKKIVNLMLQKKYVASQISQGAGKTLMSIHTALYRKKFNNTKNTLVIAPSIAINQTWIGVLESYKIPFTVITKLSDVKKIKKNDFILITFNMLCKYQKHLKKYLNKSISNNYTLILDESDSICNITSSRTKATLSVGKKARFKVLLSGTMTRNDISESYTLFKLMYGESMNFICNCSSIFVMDKETNQLIEKNNEEKNKPFLPYQKGYKLFRSCFNPQKITVFGVGQNTQDIYNSEELKVIINKSIITRTFEQVVGRKIYSIHQHLVEFNDSEKALYNKVINEFYSMKYLFNSTGNARKDRFLEIVQQLNLLLDVCCQAQSYREYKSTEAPEKFLKVLELLNMWNNERVLIGCRTLKEVELYRNFIGKNIKNRKLYVVTGSVSMERRKEIIEELRQDDTGILLSTQQSLSSSVSIPFVDNCIITRLAWNMPTLSQFYFRIIRYNSTEDKEVHFITYKNSLETNLLALISSKENLNNFMKNNEDEDVEAELGINFNMIDMLLTKEKDQEGKMRINWGSQNII